MDRVEEIAHWVMPAYPCHQAWLPEFSPGALHDGEESASTSYPLTSAGECVPAHTHK